MHNHEISTANSPIWDDFEVHQIKDPLFFPEDLVKISCSIMFYPRFRYCPYTIPYSIVLLDKIDCGISQQIITQMELFPKIPYSIYFRLTMYDICIQYVQFLRCQSPTFNMCHRQQDLRPLSIDSWIARCRPGMPPGRSYSKIFPWGYQWPMLNQWLRNG